MNDKGNNPFFTGIAPDPVNKQGDTTHQIEAGKEEELRAHQTGKMPDPLDKVNPFLADVFEKMVQIKGLANQVSGNPSVNSANLTTLQNKIDDINSLILDLPKYFATISL